MMKTSVAPLVEPAIASSILEWTRASTAGMVELTKMLVEEESPSDIPESQAAVQGLLADAFSEAGLKVQRVRGRLSGGHLIALSKREDHPVQLLLGHSDTVWPRGTLDEMPFTDTNDRLTGPGVYDMKAGLAQMVFALRAISALDLEPSVGFVILINSDEELGSGESRPVIEELAARSQRAFVLEPSIDRDGKLKTARKGGGGYEIVLRGRAAHAGLDPAAGASAILELSHMIQKLHELNDPARGISVNIGTIEGGLRPNVIAPFSRANVDVRVPTQADADRIDTAIRALVTHDPEIRVEVRGGMTRPPMERLSGGARLWRAALEAGDAMGLRLDEGVAGGTSDGNFAARHAPVLDGLGAVGGGAHTSHEFASEPHLAERAALLALLLLLPPLEEG